MRTLITLWLIICSVNVSASITDQGQIPFSWIKLLHYKQVSGGKYKSLLEDPKFFLAPSGGSTPIEELNLNIEALKTDPFYSCRFPARAQLLSETYNITFSNCKDVQNWKNSISGPSLAIVFVGQYISNPASVFGHTFILFKDPAKPLNLNTTLNYAAQMSEDVGLYDYVVGGLTGRFSGEFGFGYFYSKLQEYSAIENRDMWIYDLELDQHQLDQFLNHVWELSHFSKEGYIFSNNNCSVSTYNALAAVHPDLDFLNPKSLYVLPLSTVQRLEKISKKHSYIPSKREQVRQGYLGLDEDEKDKFNNFISDPLLNSEHDSVALIDLKVNYFEFLKTSSGGKLASEETEAYSKALVKRSRLGVPAYESIFSEPPTVHTGYTPWRIGLGYGENRNLKYSALIFSPVSHHLIQKENGYLPNSELVLLEAEMQSYRANTFELDRLTLFSLENFPYRTVFDPRKSWTAKFDLRKDDSCNGCYFSQIETRIGTSIAVDNHLGYALVGLSDRNDHVFHPEATLGTVLNFKRWKSRVQLTHIQPVQSKYQVEDIFSVAGNIPINNSFDLELLYETSQRTFSSKILVNHFF